VNSPSRWIFGVFVLVALVGPGSAYASPLATVDGPSFMDVEQVVSAPVGHSSDLGTRLHAGHVTPVSSAAFAFFLGLRRPSRVPGKPLTPDGAPLGNLFQLDSVRRM